MLDLRAGARMRAPDLYVVREAMGPLCDGCQMPIESAGQCPECRAAALREEYETRDLKAARREAMFMKGGK
jgi:tRNA(Ile2) C34 agmatinyltransferase TiaS